MPEKKEENKSEVIQQIAEKIKGAESILVALSKDPTVDEMSAAIGLAMILDKIGKHATAIYSGVTPNAIQFLNPEKTFEADTNSLQDFIIALAKDKADHLRYKVDGDYVKVYITPYRTQISESDLEFSHGDFNVDLIVALDVASQDDLDGALAEHGRITHDASAVNITTGEPGNFGEIAWSETGASSVSEMVAELAPELFEKKDEVFDKETATALLTGIVAETERFSNAKTTPGTMGVAAKLMMAGADQQLIVAQMERASEEAPNPEGRLEIEPGAVSGKDAAVETLAVPEAVATADATATESVAPEGSKFDIQATEPVVAPAEPILETPAELKEETPEVTAEPVIEEEKKVELQPSGEVSAEPSKFDIQKEEPAKAEPVAVEPAAEAAAEPAVPEPVTPTIPVSVDIPEAPASDPRLETGNLGPAEEAQAELEKIVNAKPEGNPLMEELMATSGVAGTATEVMPEVGLASIDSENIDTSSVKDYGKLMEEALAEPMPNPAVQAAPTVMAGPEANHIPVMDYTEASSSAPEMPPVMQDGVLQPVQQAAEPVPAGMEQAQAGMIEVTPTSGEIELPPPPTPPVGLPQEMMPPVAPTTEAQEGMQVTPIAPAEAAAPAMPVASAETASTEPASPVVPAAPVAAEPATMQIPVQTPSEPGAQPMMTSAEPAADPTQPPVEDPSAFKIPGM